MNVSDKEWRFGASNVHNLLKWRLSCDDMSDANVHNCGSVNGFCQHLSNKKGLWVIHSPYLRAIYCAANRLLPLVFALIRVEMRITTEMIAQIDPTVNTFAGKEDAPAPKGAGASWSISLGP